MTLLNRSKLSFHFWFVIVVFGFLSIYSASVHAAIPGDFNGHTDETLPVLEVPAPGHLELYDQVEFLETSPDTSIDELDLSAFQTLTADQRNRGITDQAFWLRLRLVNNGLQNRWWVLYHETAYLDDMTVYLKNRDDNLRVIELSDHQPFSSRRIDYRTLSASYFTPVESYTDVYIRLGFRQAESMNLTVHLADLITFNRMAQDLSLVQGVYYGIMLLLLLTAIVLGSMLRQSAYWYYAGFILFSGLMWAKINGVAYQHLWPNWSTFHNDGFHIVYLLASIFALQFSKKFLNTAVLLPVYHRVMQVIQVVLIIGVIMRFAGVYTPVLYISYVGLALLTLQAVVGWAAYRKGLKYARWYAAAWLFYGVGLTLSVTTASTTLFSWGLTPLAYAQFGSAVEAVFLLIALGERFMMWEHERQQALLLVQQDDLTGLGNRRKLDVAFREFKQRQQRNQQPVFLTLVAFDECARVLEELGHDAADSLLKDMGQLIQGLTRSQDVCVRYSSHEFVILLQADSAQATYQLACDMQDELHASPTQFRGTFIRHNISIGISEVRDRNLPEVMAEAEKALHAARRNEQRQCEVYSDALLTAEMNLP